MIKHIVCWKLYEQAAGNTKAQNAALIERKLWELKHSIPEIQSMEVGINSDQAADDNYDVVLIAEFNNFDELKTYQTHKDHQAFITFIAPLRSDKVAVDYKIPERPRMAENY